MSPPQPPAIQGTPAAAQQQAPAASTARVFASDSGIIFNAIKPDRVDDFETVLERLQQALASSTDPMRRAQAAGWKIFKAAEPGPGGSVLYVFVMNPALMSAWLTTTYVAVQVMKAPTASVVAGQDSFDDRSSSTLMFSTGTLPVLVTR